MPASPDHPQAMSTVEAAARRRGAARTALLFGAIAVVIYVAFILSGVLAA